MTGGSESGPSARQQMHLGMFRAFWLLVVVVVVLDIASFFTFAALLKANRVSPELGGVFLYGRVLLAQAIPIAATILCCIVAYRYCIRKRHRLSAAVAVTVLVAAATYTITMLLAGVALGLLDKVLSWVFDAFSG